MEPKQLKRLIDDRGMKQKFVAGKLNVSSALVTQWLTGVKPIANRHIHELKRIFA